MNNKKKQDVGYYSPEARTWVTCVCGLRPDTSDLVMNPTEGSDGILHRQYCYHITLLLINCAKQVIYPGVVELTTQLPRLIIILWLPLCRINKFGLKYFPQRLSRSPTLVGRQDYILAPLPGCIALFIKITWELFVFCNLSFTMGKLKDSKTKIMPSKTRGGKDLPTSSTLDSPTVLSQLVTPPPSHAPHTSMSHTVGTASTSDDTFDDASTMLSESVPLGELLDAHIAKAKEIETTENFDESPVTPSSPVKRIPLNLPSTPVFDEEFTREFMAYDDRGGIEGLIEILKKKAMNKLIKPDPKFGTSPIYVDDNDYEFSVDPTLITMVESDPFHGYELKRLLIIYINYIL